MIQGSMPKAKSRHAKATRVAMDEIDKNLVKWQLEAPVDVEPTDENE